MEDASWKYRAGQVTSDLKTFHQNLGKYFIVENEIIAIPLVFDFREAPSKKMRDNPCDIRSAWHRKQILNEG